MQPSSPELISESHVTEEFDCGKFPLNNWLHTRAKRNHRERFTAVRVIHCEMKVVGFYGFAPSAITPLTLPRSIRTGQPPDPMPCFLLGQLAVDTRWAGKGIGSGLVKHALLKVVEASQLTGGSLLIVNAVDAEAHAYWQSWGFASTKDDEMTLYRSVAKIAASLRA
jgi:predicted N-acetyltransferase YhbS